MKHRYDIDGLRAVAIIPVILFHLDFSILPGGFVGVDVFFVISGFLITGIINKEISSGQFSLRGFYERRARRILPALCAMMLITYSLGLFYLAPHDFKDLGASVAFSALSVSNIYFWRSIGYFEIAANFRPLLHTWSLAIEEQFYIILPIMFLLSNWVFRHRIAVVVSISIASFLIAMALGRSPAAFYLLPARAFELGIGSALALIANGDRVDRVKANALGVTGLVAIGLSLVVIDESFSFPGPWALLPTLGTALVLYAGMNGEGLAARVLSFAPLRFVGLISYSAYLWHWPVIVAARFWFAGPLDLPTKLVLIIIILVVAIASWRWIEQPFRDKKVIGTNTVFRSAYSSIVVASVVGALTWYSGGLPVRFPFGPTPIGAESARLHTCFLEFGDPVDAWTPEKCTTRVGSGGATVFLWGDSFASHYAPGIASLSEAGASFNLVQANFSACPPFAGYTDRLDDRCGRFNQRVMDSIRDLRPKIVVLAASWSHDQGAFDQNEDKLYDIMKATVEKLAKLGVHTTILIGDSPRYYLDVEQLNIHPGLPVAKPVNNLEYNSVLHLVAKDTSALYADPMEFLCSSNGCRIRGSSDEILHWDDGHYTLAGSRMMAKEMLYPLLNSSLLQ